MLKVCKVIIAFVLLGLCSCITPPADYNKFTEGELDFVSYHEGQSIKFIDTNNVVGIYKQTEYERYFYEFNGMMGPTNTFQEKYRVTFSGAGYLFVALGAEVISYPGAGGLNIQFNNYTVSGSAVFSPRLSSKVINGITYKDVYSIRAFKPGTPYLSDTATMYYNREHGVIQLLFPNGKSITRID
ncbi:hypothetical protein [Rufibacter roseus]|uniref:Lipoprotein n=1 Tax=Rufibacter roseus TaxID=1567108 RepID=A0ABW2DHV8_9BACT|nr:hypothetical protein [Rufibacter roseus]